MNIEEIRQLAGILQDGGLTALEVCEGDVRIRLERSVTAALPPPEVALPALQAALPEETVPSAVDFNRLTEVKAPMVGVFYAAPSPDAEPFVKRGDRVNRGDVLCIIEAMKLLNEIVAETDGEIVDICAQNGQVVEYSQTLFKIY